MRHRCELALLILPLALAASPGWTADGGVRGKSVCVFPLVDFSPSGEKAEHQKPLSAAVEQEFQAVGFTAVPRDTWAPVAAGFSLEPERIVNGPQALRIAQSAGADMAVVGFYRLDKDRILVSMQCYDVNAGTVITGFMDTWRFNLGFYNSLHAEIADLVQKVIFSTAPKLISLSEEVRVDEITFTSPQEGMEVVVQGDRSIGRIEGGALVFRTDGMKAGELFIVEKRQQGYHAVKQTVRAAPQVALTPIPRTTVFAQEVNWTAGQLEGLGTALRWYPVPDWIMLVLSEYLYTQVPTVPGGNWPVHADSELLAGTYLFLPPESRFRMGISLGIGVILTWVPATSLPLFTDVYLNLLNILLEYKVGTAALFFRIEGKVPLGIGSHLLEGGPIAWNAFLAPITFGVVIPW